ncbi:MAG: glycine--tRNA ligase subunit beta [Nitrospirota bacterium]|nr:glycine--tRNA ligase subunit beta [Nitrospirota bacterium]MDH5774786.1 glycine--tRNA ligase subunit beta [Nitrospirota bacterium]
MAPSKKPPTKVQNSSSRKPTVKSLPFLLEIGTEEIPTKVLPQALQDLAALGQQLFAEARLGYQHIRTVGTARRLALLVDGLHVQQASLTQEIVGPPKSAAFDASGVPTKAAQGFAHSQGVSIDQLTIKETPKGLYLAFQKHERGQSAKQVLAEILPGYLAKMTFARAMRWNASQAKFARPIRWMVALLGTQPLTIEFAGIRSGRVTWGHRFYRIKGKKPGLGVALTGAGTYIPALKKLGVLVDPDERRTEIIRQMAELTKTARGHVESVHREELIEEAVWGVECPHTILGTFQKDFLVLPKAVLISSMKEHQGFFSLVGKDASLLPKFMAVTNTPWGKTTLITKGNERVLSARLKDAQYFFQEDEKQPLHERVAALDGVIFHKKLGTMRQKVERIRDLAGWMAMTLDRQDLKEACERAGWLSKADLTTGMVGEFPTLQGIMGEEYARHDGEAEVVFQAIGEQYLPRFPDDQLPVSLAGRLVACADRCDSIASFFSVGMAPSGSEDPLGLRRAAYGLVRLVSEASVRLNLVEVFGQMLQILAKQGVGHGEPKTATEIINFVIDRLRFYGRNTMNVREDVMEAVTRVRPTHSADLADLVSRMGALQKIANQPDFETLMIGFKRAHRIVEKEAWNVSDVVSERFTHDSEQRLAEVLSQSQHTVSTSIAKQQYGEALEALLALKTPIDEFFASVLVNDPDPSIRENRLSLLTAVDHLFLTLADFSCIHTSGAEAG